MMYSSRFSPSSRAVSIGGYSRCFFRSSKAVLASSVHVNFSFPLTNLKKGRPLSPNLEMNLFKAAMHPMSF